MTRNRRLGCLRGSEAPVPALVQGPPKLRRGTVDRRCITTRRSSAYVGTADGVGPFGTPWERMQSVKPTISLSTCCDAAWVASPPSRSSCAQALSAAWNCELLTPISSKVVLGPLRRSSGPETSARRAGACSASSRAARRRRTHSARWPTSARRLGDLMADEPRSRDRQDGGDGDAGSADGTATGARPVARFRQKHPTV